MEKTDKLTLQLFALSVVIVLASTAYHFLYVKNYDFVLEANCDTKTEKCFHRDCSNSDDCPPNGLENYKIIRVVASDFPKCGTDSCVSECKSGVISCEISECGSSTEDACSSKEEKSVE